MSKKAKNVHLIRTDEPSRLGRFVDTGNLFLRVPNDLPRGENVNMYITVDEEIKLNDYITDGYKVWKWKDDSSLLGRKKVVLSDDPKLVKDGVQEILNDFLEFLVQNPSCERVEVELFPKFSNNLYGIILPKEELKQEFTTVNGSSGCTITVTDEKGNPLTYWGGLKEPKQEATMKETIEEAAEDYFLFNIFCDDITDFEHVVATRCFTAGAKSDAAREMWHKKFKHESINALKAIENLCDSQNPTHEDIWMIAYGVINDLTGKE